MVAARTMTARITGSVICFFMVAFSG